MNNQTTPSEEQGPHVYVPDWMAVAAAIAGLGLDMSICPHCEEEFNEGQLVHIECLRQKHGGTLPEGFQELIDAFELKGETK